MIVTINVVNKIVLVLKLWVGRTAKMVPQRKSLAFVVPYGE